MEEKTIIQSKQYNIKKPAIKLSCFILIFSVIVSILIYVSDYTSIVNSFKTDYEENYLPMYEKYVTDYNDILESYETEKEERTIYCEHTEYKTEYYYSGGHYQTYEKAIPMNKSEFLEYHPDSTSYIECAHNKKVYESFEEYKNYRFENYHGLISEFSVFPLFANLVIPIILLLYIWLRSYSLTITDKRVYGKAAFGKQVDLPLDSVSAVGTSALKGVAVGTSSGKIRFKLIKNQKEIHEEISKLLAERQRVENVPVETTVNQTIVKSTDADELKKFKELLDMGAITQEEFDAKKKELLGL